MADELVVESTRRALNLVFLDENGDVINITGSTVKLQGKSADIGTTIDVSAALTDPAQGVASVASVGNLVTAANLGGRTRATFTCRGKLTDAGAKIDYGPEFELVYVAKPV